MATALKRSINNYIVEPLGDMYMSDVTADDLRLALVPVSKKVIGYVRCSKYAYQKHFLFCRI